MLEQLKTLDALEQHKTMSQAATALRISQPTVSKRIAQLEASLGTKIIERQGRNVILTWNGMNILNKARPLLIEMSHLTQNDFYGEAKKISLGVSESILSSWGAKSLGNLGREFKTLQLVTHTHRGPVVIDRVRSGEYMLGICAGICVKAPDLMYQEIGREPFVIIKSGKKLTTIEESSETWSAIRGEANREKLKIEGRLESFFAMAQMANHGVIDALVPIGVAKSLAISKEKWRPVKVKRPIILVARKTTFEREGYAAIIKSLIKLIGVELKKL